MPGGHGLATACRWRLSIKPRGRSQLPNSRALRYALVVGTRVRFKDSRMNRLLLRLVLSSTVLSFLPAPARADDPPANTGAGAPKIFLNNSPAIVAYQLKRLTNPQLIALE